MSNRLFAAIVLFGFVTSAAVQAQDNGLGQSIMFGDQANDQSDLTTLPPSQKKIDPVDRCAAWALEIEKLKGKPQRRSTLSDRYQQECVRP